MTQNLQLQPLYPVLLVSTLKSVKVYIISDNKPASTSIMIAHFSLTNVNLWGAVSPKYQVQTLFACPIAIIGG